jgi:hypothetical protein
MFNGNLINFILTSYPICSGRTVYTRGYRSNPFPRPECSWDLGFLAMLASPLLKVSGIGI